MSDKSDKKILRIGLIQDGKIVEERLIRSRSDVKVGQQFDENDLVVPVEDLPQSYPVFELKGERYVLNFTDQMSGRISVGGEVRSLEDFKARGKAKKGANGFVLPLSPSARGRIQIGGVTLLFQFVTPPPEQPQPALPASMRGGWISGVNSALLIVIGISALIQVGFVVWVQTLEWPEPAGERKVVESKYVKIDEPEKKEEEKKKKKKEEETDEKKAEKEDTKPKPTKEPKPDPEPKKKDDQSPSEQAKDDQNRKAQMAEEVENNTVLKALGSQSEDGEGTMMANTGKGNIETAMSGDAKVTTEGGESADLETGGSQDATGQAAEVGEVETGADDADDAQATGDTQETQVNANVNLASKAQTAGGKLSQSSIRMTINSAQGRIQSCYERYLKKNTGASGKVVVSFTVGTSGAVVNSSVVSDSVGGTVGSCVASVISNLPFDRPKGGKVTVNKTFVFQSG